MSVATVDGRNVYYELHGTAGDPVVLVHGSFVDHRTWAPIVPGLATALEVVVYDRSGHGRSPASPRPHPVADDVRDLAAVLEQSDRYPAHVIGHSYGGAVAVQLAATRPDLVRSLALHEPPFVGLLGADPATAPEAERTLAELAELKALARGGHPELAARRFVEAFSSEEGAWERLPAAIRSAYVAGAPQWAEELDDPAAYAPSPAALGDLLLPVLLTTGDESPALLRRITEALAGALPFATVQRIAECGHAPHLTKPDVYLAVLGAFLLERHVPPT